LGQVALVEAIGESQAVILQNIGGAVFLVRINGLDERRLAEEQADASKLVQFGRSLS
jgi:hypothetical protein